MKVGNTVQTLYRLRRWSEYSYIKFSLSKRVTCLNHRVYKKLLFFSSVPPILGISSNFIVLGMTSLSAHLQEILLERIRKLHISA